MKAKKDERCLCLDSNNIKIVWNHSIMWNSQIVLPHAYLVHADADQMLHNKSFLVFHLQFIPYMSESSQVLPARLFTCLFPIFSRSDCLRTREEGQGSFTNRRVPCYGLINPLCWPAKIRKGALVSLARYVTECFGGNGRSGTAEF